MGRFLHLSHHLLTVVSDLIWLTDNPSQEAVAFWEGEYLDMQTIEKRLGQMRQAGFEVVDHYSATQRGVKTPLPQTPFN